MAHDSPQSAALDGLASVLVGHLQEVKGLRDGEGAGSHAGSALIGTRQGDAPPPVLVALHGPGACDLLDCIAPKLRGDTSASDGGDWTIVRFDAWQYQRVTPPWWWLVEEMDRQIRVDARSRG